MNLPSIFTTKVLMALSVAAFLSLTGVILYQKSQKTDLREQIIYLNTQIVASEASYNSCLVKIDDVARDLNQKLVSTIEESNLSSLQLERRLEKLRFSKSIENVSKIQNVKDVVNTLEWSDQKPPNELLEKINEVN